MKWTQITIETTCEAVDLLSAFLDEEGVLGIEVDDNVPLTDEEMAIFKHGRNAKSATSAKNASITDYRIATGFEALIGYLYLSHEMDRAMELVKEGLTKTELLPYTLS